MVYSHFQYQELPAYMRGMPQPGITVNFFQSFIADQQWPISDPPGKEYRQSLFRNKCLEFFQFNWWGCRWDKGGLIEERLSFGYGGWIPEQGNAISAGQMEQNNQQHP